MEAEKRYDAELCDAYYKLKDALPDCSNQEATRPNLLNRGVSYSTRNFNHQAFNFYFLAVHDLATQHILDLEERNKEIRARILEEEEIYFELLSSQYQFPSLRDLSVSNMENNL